MANLRSFSTVLVTVLSIAIPSLASAQRVHEVRPAPEGEVRIGVTQNGSMDDLLTLARRISGDSELTADDVIANNGHVRYVCHTGGHHLFSRTDDFAGRCPEDADRTHDGLVRGTYYRVPRRHGETLPPPNIRPHRSTVAAPADTAALDAVIADRNSLREQLAASDQSNFALQDEIDRLGDQLEEARLALRAAASAGPEPITIIRTVHEPAPAVSSRPEMGVLLVGFMLGMAALLIFFGLYYRERTLRPYWKYIQELRQKIALYERFRRVLKHWYKEHMREFNELKNELADLKDKFAALEKRRQKERDEEVALRNKENDDRAVHRALLVTRNARIGVLREMDDKAEVIRLQVLEFEGQIAEQTKRGDSTLVKHYEFAIVQCKANLAELKNSDGQKFDSEEVKKELEELVLLQMIDLHKLTGIEFDGTSTDKWRAEIEAEARQQMHGAEAKKAQFDALLVIAEQERVAALEKIEGERAHLARDNERELADAKRKLDEEYAEKDRALTGKLFEAGLAEKMLAALRGDPQARGEIIFAMEAKIADLERRIVHGGSWEDPVAPDPPTPEEPITDDGFSERPPRHRRDTDALARTEIDLSRVSVHGTPPLRKETALLASISEFLNVFSRSGNGSSSHDKTLRCSEHEARDVAYLLHNFQIVSPLLDMQPVRLRKFAIKLESAGKLNVLESRRQTIPPPGPSYG